MGKPRPNFRTPGTMYLALTGSGLVKIGFTTRKVQRRLAEQTSDRDGAMTLVCSVEAVYRDERFLHSALRAFRAYPKGDYPTEIYRPSKRFFRAVARHSRVRTFAQLVRDIAKGN